MRNDKGFILITLLFMLLLLSVTAYVLNSRSAVQSRMASNQTLSTQTYLGQTATLEKAVWTLNQSPGWRTVNESFSYGGVSYTRTVQDSSGATGYADAVTISVKAPGGASLLKESYRYYLDTPPAFINKSPYGIRGDSADNLYFADTNSHSVWRVDAASGLVSRVAGTGMSGWSGDGGLATLASLYAPQGLCIAATGEIYVADTGNHRIRRIAFGGITTYAGTGTADYAGDGGPAVNAALSGPASCFVDSAGNLYVADSGNCMIRKIDAATKVITRVAGKVMADGNPECGYAEGPVLSAKFSAPSDLFKTASGDIYVADRDNNMIRTFQEGGNTSSVAGNGAAGYSGDLGQATAAKINKPRGVFLDGANNIFIADTGNHRIRRVLASLGIIYTAVGTGTAGYSGDGGLALLAQIDGPVGVYVNSGGDMIISDTINSTLRKVASAVISTLAVTAASGLNLPQKTAAWYDQTAGKMYLYIADTSNHRVRMLDVSTSTLTTVAGTGTSGFSGDSGQAASAQLNSPGDVALDASGNLFIADTNNSRIRKVTASTGIITTVAGTGTAGYSGDGGAATAAKLNKPAGVFVDSQRNIFIADTTNNRIRKVVTTGVIQTVAGTGTAGYSGDSGSATAAKLKTPSGVAVDASGNVFIADTGNNAVRKVSAPSGVITTVAGVGGAGGYTGDNGPATSAKLNGPTDVNVDSSGSIFIVDSNNSALRLVRSSDGEINTIAGGTKGLNGDNQPAVTAMMDTPGGIALPGVKGSGRIYIADTNNNRIRVLWLKKVKELY